jgi:hypothetical protein
MYAPVAQWIERRRPKAGVGGSTPSGRTGATADPEAWAWDPAKAGRSTHRGRLAVAGQLEGTPAGTSAGTSNLSP